MKILTGHYNLPKILEKKSYRCYFCVSFALRLIAPQSFSVSFRRNQIRIWNKISCLKVAKFSGKMRIALKINYISDFSNFQFLRYSQYYIWSYTKSIISQKLKVTQKNSWTKKLFLTYRVERKTNGLRNILSKNL